MNNYTFIIVDLSSLYCNQDIWFDKSHLCFICHCVCVRFRREVGWDWKMKGQHGSLVIRCVSHLIILCGFSRMRFAFRSTECWSYTIQVFKWNRGCHSLVSCFFFLKIAPFAFSTFPRCSFAVFPRRLFFHTLSLSQSFFFLPKNLPPSLCHPFTRLFWPIRFAKTAAPISQLVLGSDYWSSLCLLIQQMIAPSVLWAIY